MSKGKPPQKVRLTEVAQRAGVSSMTVSKVLRGTGSISEKTSERVKQAADELGYVPNSLAGSLSSKKSTFVGVIIPSAGDVIFAEILSGINERLRPHGLNTLIGETLFDGVLEEEILRTMLSLQPAGLIINGGINRTERGKVLLERRNGPLIQIWDADDSCGDVNIGLSHRQAGRRMARHFLERGYRSIGYVGTELQKDICAHQRFLGFVERIEETGLSVTCEIETDLPRQASSGPVLTERLLQRAPETDAIFYLNDAMAVGALSWLHDAGVSVPGKLAVAGFNGTSLAHTIRTRVTTLDVPRRGIGEAAGQALTDILQGHDVAPHQRIDPVFVAGNTS